MINNKNTIKITFITVYPFIVFDRASPLSPPRPGGLRTHIPPPSFSSALPDFFQKVAPDALLFALQPPHFLLNSGSFSLLIKQSPAKKIPGTGVKKLANSGNFVSFFWTSGQIPPVFFLTSALAKPALPWR